MRQHGRLSDENIQLMKSVHKQALSAFYLHRWPTSIQFAVVTRKALKQSANASPKHCIFGLLENWCAPRLWNGENSLSHLAVGSEHAFATEIQTISRLGSCNDYIPRYCPDESSGRAWV